LDLFPVIAWAAAHVIGRRGVGYAVFNQHGSGFLDGVELIDSLKLASGSALYVNHAFFSFVTMFKASRAICADFVLCGGKSNFC